jgi:hypothetical protein
MLHSRPITAEHAGPAFRFGDSGKVPRTVSLPVAQILIRRNAVIFRHIGLACVDRDRAIASPALRPRSPVPHQFPPQLQKNVVRPPRPSNRSRTFCGILRCAHWTSTVKQVVPGSAVIMLFLENNIAPSGKREGPATMAPASDALSPNMTGAAATPRGIGLDKAEGGGQSPLANSPSFQRNRQGRNQQR